MRLLMELDKKLAKSRSCKRTTILRGVYNQLAVGGSERQSKGVYRNLVDMGGREADELVDYVSSALIQQKMYGEAKRLINQHGLIIEGPELKENTSKRLSGLNWSLGNV